MKECLVAPVLCAGTAVDEWQRLAGSCSELHGGIHVRRRESRTDLYLESNDFAGLSFDLDLNANAFRRVVIAQYGDVGIFMRNANRNSFNDVTIIERGNHAVFIAENDENHLALTRNRFHAFFVATWQGFGMRVADASCTDNSVVQDERIGFVLTEAVELRGDLFTDSKRPRRCRGEPLRVDARASIDAPVASSMRRARTISRTVVGIGSSDTGTRSPRATQSAAGLGRSATRSGTTSRRLPWSRECSHPFSYSARIRVLASTTC
jgi:hypothetical protein